MSQIPYAQLSPVPARVSPIAPVVVVPPRRQINPLIPLICIGVILFLIAATIVIALIPVYVEKNVYPTDIDSVPYTALYRINNGTLPVGNLTIDNCAVIQNDQQSFASANNDVSPNSPTLIQCTVTTNTSVTRRRRQTQQFEANLIVLSGFLRGIRSCRRGACLVNRTQTLITSLLNRGVFYLTLAGANGTRFVFSITCISASVSPAQSVARANDIAILNYALILEQLEANFYTRFQSNFTLQDFTAVGFTQQDYDYLNMIYVHELAHVRALRAIISQLGGTPNPECSYNFSAVQDVRSYLQTARILENTGTMAYDGAANGIADTTLRQIAATIATVEARHSSYLNSISGLIPFPNVFDNATDPSTVIAMVSPFIISCPFTITPPKVPYVGAVSFSGIVPTSNTSSISSYTNLMYVNDLRVLNFALVAEQLEANFYNRYVSTFTSADFIANGFPDVSSLFIIIREHENAHVQFLRMTIEQRRGTPVSECSYNFNVTNVKEFVHTSRLFENTGVKAYDGAINRLTDPNLILSAATIATVEARYAAFLNKLENEIPFPNVTDPTLTPAEVVAALSSYQICPFTPELPLVLNPSDFVPVF